MAEITSAAASAATLGVSAAALSAVGLDSTQLGVSFMACLFGAGLAPQMSYSRHVFAFCSAVVCAAVAGKFLAVRFLDSGPLSAAFCTIAAGIFFHPAVGLVDKSLPQLRDMALRIIGGKK